MQAVGVAVLCALVACYSPGYKDCEITCASGACPSGFRCEQGVCRAPGFSGACGQMSGDGPQEIDARTIDANPVLDDDNDGVMNGNDNCLDKPNTNQANEDGDAFGDVCDPCPIKPTANDNADSDGDGVGNGCEPEQTGMHMITVFEGFADATAPTSIASLNPTNVWSFSGGVARANIPNNQRAWMLWPAPNNGMNRFDVVWAQYTILSNTGSDVGVGLAQAFDPTQANGMSCQIGRNVDGTMGIRILVVTDPASATTGGAPFGVNQVVQMRFIRDGASSRYICFDDQSVSSTSSTLNPVFGNPHVGLYTQAISATYDWVMIVTRVN